MKNNLSVAEKKRRLQIISKAQNQVSLETNRTLIGTTVEVLVEGASKNNPEMQTGRTRSNKLVHFLADQDLTGKLVEVPIVEAYTWHLIGGKPGIFTES